MVLRKKLIISTCQHKLHENEFVKPVKDIVFKSGFEFDIVKYDNLLEFDFSKYSHILICGTALKDFDYMNYIDDFSWVKKVSVPILGICAGSHIVGLVYGSELKKGCEIGSREIEVVVDDKVLKGVRLRESFVLHNSYVDVPKGFVLLAKTAECPQLFKKGDVYGVLFHPEVRDKKLIENFIKYKN